MRPTKHGAWVLCCAISLHGLAGCAATTPPASVEEWIERQAIELDQEPAPALPASVRSARIVGLGESTHGQHEAFEWKRALTMRLIREEGVRVVAYEASASSAVACDEYIAGAHDDLTRAMKGLGMLIWNVEENARLLRDLRAWNERAAPADRVRFLGFDVQDTRAVAARLRAALEPTDPALAERTTAAVAAYDRSLETLMAGDPAAYRTALAEIGSLREAIAAATPSLSEEAAREVRLRSLELLYAVEVPSSPGARDRAMALLFLEQLDAMPAGTKAVAWAHNQHLHRSVIMMVGATEPAMGAVLGERIGTEYVAVGFLTGEGAFAALDRDSVGWGFRTYRLDPPPPAAFEAPFARVASEPILLDLRSAPTSGPVAAWLDATLGHRTFGGYGLPPDVQAMSSDPARLWPARPRSDWDALLFLPRTTTSTPYGTSRRLP